MAQENAEFPEHLQDVQTPEKTTHSVRVNVLRKPRASGWCSVQKTRKEQPLCPGKCPKKNRSICRGLYCPPLIPARIRAIPRIPEESNLAEGPAKLIQWFRWNFEWNSHSARMVPGITRKESIPRTRQSGILAESLFVDNVQIECRHLPMLDLGVINKQLHSFSTTTTIHDAYQPRSPPLPMTTTNHDA